MIYSIKCLAVWRWQLLFFLVRWLCCSHRAALPGWVSPFTLPMELFQEYSAVGWCRPLLSLSLRLEALFFGQFQLSQRKVVFLWHKLVFDLGTWEDTAEERMLSLSAMSAPRAVMTDRWGTWPKAVTTQPRGRSRQSFWNEVLHSQSTSCLLTSSWD